MKRLLYISFNDSFDFNIISYLQNYNVSFVHFLDIDEKKIADNDIYFLGPGPGHVDEYFFIFSFIDLMKSSNRPLIGLCLGHQLLLQRVFSFKLERSKTIIHGQGVSININGVNTIVQRYNSWSCISDKTFKHQYFDEFSELALFQEDNVLTMQFHPESVGTSCPKLFFEIIDYFIVHNSIDGYFEDKNKWNLRQTNNQDSK